eukprot:1436434-Pyramimonas_sp.AAC.1
MVGWAAAPPPHYQTARELPGAEVLICYIPSGCTREPPQNTNTLNTEVPKANIDRCPVPVPVPVAVRSVLGPRAYAGGGGSIRYSHPNIPPPDAQKPSLGGLLDPRAPQLPI